MSCKKANLAFKDRINCFLEKELRPQFRGFFEVADFEGVCKKKKIGLDVCFCTSVDAKMAGRSENAIRFAISTIHWELESFQNSSIFSVDFVVFT